MATGPVDADPGESLRTEHDALILRCAASEQQVEQLTAELASAHEQLEALRAQVAAGSGGLSLFDGTTEDRRVAGDGTDPRILSMALGATALVGAMVTVLALLSHTLMTPFGLLILVLTIGLTWAALQTKVEPIEVSVVRGLVYVKKGDSTHRFDVRNASTVVTQVGSPGDAGWKLEFARKGMDPFVINASMVDPADFMAQLRQWRSEL